MATLQKRNGSYRILFCYGKRRLTFTVGEVSEREAENWVAAVDQTLLRIEQGLLKVPPGADITKFVKHGGKVEEELAEIKPPITFKELTDDYLAAHSNGAVEANSLDTIRMHLRHVAGGEVRAGEADLDDSQRHVNQRAKKQYRGKPLSPVTLKKELASFRTAWNWGVQGTRLTKAFPGRGLVYPKADEKPPFMTWQEIERKVAAGGLSEAEVAELWDCLFLQQPEVVELLDHVKGQQRSRGSTRPASGSLSCASGQGRTRVTP